MNVCVVPCKGCDSRYVGCHAKCPEYKGWRAEFDQRKAEKRAYDMSKDNRTEAYYNRRKYSPPVVRRDGK